MCVPAAAAVAVLVRFAISRYLESPLYKGHVEDAEAEAVAAKPKATGRTRRRAGQGD